jgi:hypothetical protein
MNSRILISTLSSFVKCLSDYVTDNAKGLSQVTLGTLGKGFDIITDIKTGPDGYLYIVPYSEYSIERLANVSRIYRTVHAS